MATIKHTKGAECGVFGHAGIRCSTGVRSKDVILAVVVELIGLQLEGVFRTVVGFP